MLISLREELTRPNPWPLLLEDKWQWLVSYSVPFILEPDKASNATGHHGKPRSCIWIDGRKTAGMTFNA